MNEFVVHGYFKRGSSAYEHIDLSIGICLQYVSLELGCTGLEASTIAILDLNLYGLIADHGNVGGVTLLVSHYKIYNLN